MSPNNVQSEEVNLLMIKLLKNSEGTEETITLLQNEALHKNQFYPYLESLLLGDFDKFAKLDKKVLQGTEINQADLERKVKIQAIPRVLSINNKCIQVASYQQISEILHINKENVEDYIIDAIQEGILKAKIDESSETIIIKYFFCDIVRSNTEHWEEKSAWLYRKAYLSWLLGSNKSQVTDHVCF